MTVTVKTISGKSGQGTMAAKKSNYGSHQIFSESMPQSSYERWHRNCYRSWSLLGPLTFVSLSLMFLIVGFAAGTAFSAHKENELPRIAAAPSVSHGLPVSFHAVKDQELASNSIAESSAPPAKPKPKANDQCTLVEDKDRMDCNPDDPVGEQPCTQRGCCWAQPKGQGQSFLASNQSIVLANMPPLNTPYCFYPANYKGYKVTKIDQSQYFISVALERLAPSGFKADIKNVKVNIWMLNDKTVRIKIVDADKRRYEVPMPKLNIEKKPAENPLYSVKVTQDGKLTVSRKSNGVQIFSTDLSLMVYADQLLQLSSKLPTESIYGLAEQKSPFVKKTDHWSRYTFFNRDQAPTEGMNLYGAHPFYMAVEDDAGNTDGVFLFNSNGMDVILSPKPAITYRVVGGIFDFFIFMGPTPAEVTAQYLKMIGKPMLPPYWGLGFHLCKYGYGTLNKTMEVWKRTRDAGIPFDVQWNDIDYLDSNKDFTYDHEKFAGLPEFVNQLHSVGMKYVIITDPGVSASEPRGEYAPFDEGVQMDAFIKNATGGLLIGKVWTGSDTVWPDFTSPKGVMYWTRQVKRFHDEVPFDGLWIDMNEPSNFLDGDKYGCPESDLEHPQYLPGGHGMSEKTLCMTAKQHLGLHYNVHNLYGISETIATNVALKASRGKRPFIISRSTFPGQGHFGGHWDGDISSSWDHMVWTIGSVLEMNFLGIPLIGGDICGFNGNTDPEMCARWSALGAFYPFSRNHNSDNSPDQDPVALGPSVVSSAKYALSLRYSLLPYLYTMFSRASLYGETVARPLFFEFPKDKSAHLVDKAFLWGPSVYIVPVVEQSKTSVEGYLPAGKWLKYDTDVKNFKLYKSTGQNFTLDTPIDKINVFLRDGSVIPTQPPKQTTGETRKGKFTLLTVLDDQQKAKGQLYHDDGDSLDTIQNANYTVVDFSVEQGTLKSVASHTGYQEQMTLEKIILVSLSSAPTKVTLNDKQVNFKALQISDNSNGAINAVEVYDLDVDLKQQFTVKWM